MITFNYVMIHYLVSKNDKSKKKKSKKPKKRQAKCF